MMRTCFILTAVLAFTATSMAAGIEGQWHGTSVCTIRDSPCHDEQVVYVISRPDAKGKHKIDADKIVNGQRDPMGTLDCTYDTASSTTICDMKGSIWKFTVTGDKIQGTLTLADGRLYRNVSLTRD